MRHRHRLVPDWVFPFRVLGDCIFVSPSVWNVRWHRDLTRQQKLTRAQAFIRNTRP